MGEEAVGRALQRRAGAVALVCALATALAGCGGGDEIVGLDRIGNPDAPKTLKLQVNASYSPQASTPSVAEGFTKLYAEWARRHPEWRIDLIIVPESQTTSEQSRLLEKARVGHAPDCANVDSFTVPLFIEQEALTPLDDHFDRRQVEELFPYVRDVISGPDDRVYAWWWSTDLRLIYRRTDLVPEAPKTWDELLEAAQAAREEAPEVAGYLFNAGRWEATTFDHLGYFWQQGGELLDGEGRPVFAEGDNGEAMLEVLRFLQRAVQDGASPSRVATFTSYDEFETAALGGSVAMFLGGSFQWTSLEESLPEEEFAKWEVSELPGREAGQTATGTGGWAMGALTDDPEKIAACASILKEVYIGAGNELTGELPTSRRLYDELEAFQAPIFNTFRRFLRNGRARPGLAIYPALSSELQIAIGSVITGSATPEEALETARERVDQAYDLVSGS